MGELLSVANRATQNHEKGAGMKGIRDIYNGKETHNCNEMQECLKIEELSNYYNGHSVNLVVKNNSDQWVATQDHQEYATVIRFCPFCGMRLK